MAEDNPSTVFVAPSLAVAEAAVKLLGDGGIETEVIVPPPQTASEPIMGVTEMVEPAEFQIRVLDAAKAADANKLLSSALTTAKLRAIQEKRANRTGMVSVACEECGKMSEWPATAMGTTEVCPHCTAYMDIPDPDDPMADMDFGEAEDDADEETEK